MRLRCALAEELAARCILELEVRDKVREGNEGGDAVSRDDVVISREELGMLRSHIHKLGRYLNSCGGEVDKVLDWSFT